MVIIIMKKWFYEVVIAMMVVKVSRGDYWQDGGSKVGVFGDYGGRLVLR